MGTVKAILDRFLHGYSGYYYYVQVNQVCQVANTQVGLVTDCFDLITELYAHSLVPYFLYSASEVHLRNGLLFPLPPNMLTKRTYCHPMHCPLVNKT